MCCCLDSLLIFEPNYIGVVCRYPIVVDRVQDHFRSVREVTVEMLDSLRAHTLGEVRDGHRLDYHHHSHSLLDLFKKKILVAEV